MNHRVFRFRDHHRQSHQEALADVIEQSVDNELYGHVPFRWKTRGISGKGRGAALQFAMMMTEIDSTDAAADQFTERGVVAGAYADDELIPCGNDIELNVLRMGDDLRMGLVVNASQFSRDGARGILARFMATAFDGPASLAFESTSNTAGSDIGSIA